MLGRVAGAGHRHLINELRPSVTTGALKQVGANGVPQVVAVQVEAVDQAEGFAGTETPRTTAASLMCYGEVSRDVST